MSCLLFNVVFVRKFFDVDCLKKLSEILEKVSKSFLSEVFLPKLFRPEVFDFNVALFVVISSCYSCYSLLLTAHQLSVIDHNPEALVEYALKTDTNNNNNNNHHCKHRCYREPWAKCLQDM